MVCDNPYLLIIVEAQNIFPWSFLISFNSHSFSCIIFNFLETWPKLLGSHISYTTPHTHPITLSDPPTCFHSPAFFHRPTTTHESSFGVKAKQWREWRKGSQDDYQRWAPAPSAYKRPPPASNFFTQAFQKTTQVSVFSFKRRSSSSEVRRRVEGKRRVEERLVVFEWEQGPFSK